jgi:uncharacterized protein YecE (DUF72 family)
MAPIMIGTSGYSYTEWVGLFYPEGTKQEEFLSWYATQFPTVELNFSYYRMPDRQQLLRMHTQAPSLLFSIKAHESLTHTVDTTSWRTVADTFYDAVAILQEQGILAAILFQFPFSFHYDVDRRRYLDALLRRFKELPLAVEFRNGHWYNNRTIESLRNRTIALTSLDLPQISGTPPIMDVATGNLAYIRLHGRNKDQWWGSDAASRYDYCYSKQELTAIAERIRSLAATAHQVLVYFNNHRRAQAAQNAQALISMLQQGGFDDR